MANFELIKEYPGSPELGYVSSPKTEIDNTMTNNHYYSGSWFDPSLFPDFWRKVEEIDYDILTWYSPSGRLESKVHSKFDSLHTKINSVKRLSDGEVFTIGDRINVLDSVSGVQIKSFDVRTALWVNYDGGSCTVNIPQKLKTPLFTTEDGVEMFKGDTYYYIVTSNANIGHEWKVLDHIVDWNNKIKPPLGAIQFVSKEKAEEYILMNFSCLSIKDVCPVFGKMYLDNSKDALDRITTKLQELVKSKL